MQATEISQIISETAETLETFDPGTEDFDSLDSLNHDLVQLQRAIAHAFTKMNAASKAIWESARAENKTILNATFKRIMEDIPREKNRLSGELKGRISRYEEKLAVLRGQGLSETEAAAVLPPVSQAERDEVAANIAALTEEEKVLSQYRRSGPKFDHALLKNTALAHMIPDALPETVLPEAA